MKPDSGRDATLPHRRRARRLLHDLRSSDEAVATGAAKRFAVLRTWRDYTPAQVLQDRDRVQLKHALAVIALERGYDSWVALKHEASPAPPPSREHATDLDPPLYDRGLDVLLNRWFARYPDALASLRAHGGFLLPYGRQFFICESEGVRVLGLDPQDPDWERIGWNWVDPADRDAWRRLRERRRATVTAGEEAAARAITSSPDGVETRPTEDGDPESDRTHR